MSIILGEIEEDLHFRLHKESSFQLLNKYCHLLHYCLIYTWKKVSRMHLMLCCYI